MLGTRPPPFRNSRQRGEGRASHRASATAPQAGPSSYLSRKISNIKGIPSLQFSSTDLAGSLNAALGLRSSRSLESFQAAEALKKRPRPRGIVMASPTKTDSNRDRYKSYFLNDIISAAEAEEGVPKQEDTEKSLQEQEELIQEIEKISIPSITHLSMRLSELFPAIKGSRSEPDIAKTVADIRSTIEEIRELGSVDSIENGRAKRSSVGSMVRPSHEAGDVGEKRKSSATKSILDKELPPLPREAHTTPRPSIASGPLPSIPGSADETVELEGNHPALIVKAQAAHRKGSVPSLKKSRSKAILKQIIPGTPDARPWNNADNFPWTSKTPAVQLKEPGTEDDGDDEGSSDTTTRLRSKKSEPSTTISDAQGVRIARTMSPGPRMDTSLIPRVSRPSVEENEEQAPLKKGIIGSISRKMSKKPRKDSAGFPLDPEFLHPHERLSATPAGDRYPSTGLTPPVGLHIDETARSFFSDDSSENEEPRIGSLRKRLTRLKGKKSHSRALSAGDATPSTQQLMSSPPHDDSIFHGSHPDVSDADVVLVMYDEPAIGMSKAEFRAKRLVEKIRRLWFRSGKLIRNISHSKQHQYHDQTHMYEGSAYEHI
jgi:serine/arginine repetitive matrix protein 2